MVGANAGAASSGARVARLRCGARKGMEGRRNEKRHCDRISSRSAVCEDHRRPTRGAAPTNTVAVMAGELHSDEQEMHCFFV